MRSKNSSHNAQVPNWLQWSVRQKRSKRAKFARCIRRLAIESLEERRVLAAGDLDTSFGSGGKLTFAFDSANTSTYATDVLSVNGKIVSAGSLGNAFGVSRLPSTRKTESSLADLSPTVTLAKVSWSPVLTRTALQTASSATTACSSIR